MHINGTQIFIKKEKNYPDNTNRIAMWRKVLFRDTAIILMKQQKKKPDKNDVKRSGNARQ